MEESGRQGGFTLIELMIVVVLVGVLAAVAIPLYQVVPERSKATECVAGLGRVRDAMRVYFAEHGTYAGASFTDGAQVTVDGVLDVVESDLMGRYFSAECFTFDGAPTATAFRIKCDGSLSTAPAGDEVAAVVRYIDEKGNITSG